MSRSKMHRVYAPSARKSIQPDETTEQEFLDAINAEENMSGAYLSENCEDDGLESVVADDWYCN